MNALLTQTVPAWLAASAIDLAVLLAVLLVVDRVAGARIGPRCRYLLWSLLLVRMLLPALPPDPLGWKASPQLRAEVVAEAPFPAPATPDRPRPRTRAATPAGDSPVLRAADTPVEAEGAAVEVPRPARRRPRRRSRRSRAPPAARTRVLP